MVVSALAGTTNGLLEAGHSAVKGNLDEALTIIDRLEKRHVELLPSTAADFSNFCSAAASKVGRVTNRHASRPRPLTASIRLILVREWSSPPIGPVIS